MIDFDLEETNSELYWKLHNAFNELIPSVPKDLISKLNLYSCNLGGVFRKKLENPLIEEHQKAYAICRERQKVIDFMGEMLSYMTSDNQKMIGCLRNSYKPPYDPEKFIYAWYFNHKDNPRCIDQNWIKKPENLKKCQDAFNYAMKFYNQVTEGTGAIFKYMGQWENRTKSYMGFYIPGYIGIFQLTIPQNINTDFGDDDPLDDMMLTISYSEPGKGTILWDCFNFDTICSSYTFEDLHNKFVAILRDNPTMKVIKTQEDYIDSLKKKFEESYERFIDKPETFREDEKEFLNKLVKEMSINNCKITETPSFKSEMRFMIESITKATIGK